MSGLQLGSRGQGIAVDTHIRARPPSFWEKAFSRKPLPGLIVYVCCPECAERVKRDPATYIIRVFNEMNGSPPETARTYSRANPTQPMPGGGRSASLPSSAVEPGWVRR